MNEDQKTTEQPKKIENLEKESFVAKYLKDFHEKRGEPK